MIKRNKIWLLILLGAATFALFFLSSGLSGLELHPATRFNLQTNLNAAVTILGLVLFALVILYVVFFPPARRGLAELRYRTLVGSLLQALLWLVALYILIRRFPLERLNMSLARLQRSFDGPSSSPSLEFARSAPAWLAYAIALAFILLAAWGSYQAWCRLRGPRRALYLLAMDARGALEGLQSGGDFRNIVLRCYSEMCQVFDRRRGIQRPEAMTPREFEKQLGSLGLPIEPISRLTRLFEEVRYGAREPGQEQERQATECLAAIIQACENRL